MNFDGTHIKNRNFSYSGGVSVFFILFILLISTNAFSNNVGLQKSDTITKKFPEVRVTASRILSNSLAEFSPNTIIDKQTLSRTGNLQISEALIYQPGLFIKDYGGMGGMKTVSVRGSAANQTLIMLNGIRLNSNQNGMIDLSNLPLSMIGSLEIIRSGFSAAYGGNAIGGCINIIPEQFANDKLDFQIGYGSFNENYASVSAGKNFNGLQINSTFEYKHSDGNYPISINHFGKESTVSRVNSDFTNYSAVVSGNYKINKVGINSMLLFFNTDRGVPGAVLQGHIESEKARMNESGLLILLGTDINFGDNWLLKSGINARFNSINYKDDNSLGSGGMPLDNHFFSDEYNFSSDLKKQYSDGNLEFKLETFYSLLKGDMLQPGIDGNPKRTGLALSLINDYKLQFAGKVDVLFANAIRADFFNDNSPAFSPFSAIIISPSDSKLNFKLNASGNFRMPSFNELYYLNYGTANLKPEKSVSVNLAVSYGFAGFDFEAAAFWVNTKDLIVSVPKSPVIWSAQNIGTALNKGIEMIITYKTDDGKNGFNANYTIQSSDDMTENSLNYGNQIVYVPGELINLSGYADILGAVVVLNINYSSFRYSLQSNDIGSVMPEYFSVNIKLMKDFEFDLLKAGLSLSADNITDERYSIVRNFPMPGRIVRAGIDIKL